METLLGPLFVVDVFVKTFFVVPYNSGLEGHLLKPES